ncbi:MAG TPA: hypothetical protein VN936_10310, partial [Candidatus Acidoferrum sp.]|nr:hypothetical protein [Candidatus Acidoferrum sp.]
MTKSTLAVNDPRNKEETMFVDIVAWDRPGESYNAYLKKGKNRCTSFIAPASQRIETDRRSTRTCCRRP